MHARIAANRLHVRALDAVRLLDAANAAYGMMLRCLTNCYETSWHHQRRPDVLQAGMVSMRLLPGRTRL